MEILRTYPADDGFYMPAEFAPHQGTILIWPVRPGSWPYGGRDAKHTFLQLAAAIAEGEEVYLCAGSSDFEEMKEMTESFLASYPQGMEGIKGFTADTDPALIRSNIIFKEIPSDDSWARDIGPTVVVDGKGGRRGINWQFNAWGGDYNGLYADWAQDNDFALEFLKSFGREAEADQAEAVRADAVPADAENLPGMDAYDASDFVLEGGSIHSDGEGTLVVTECCLLSPGRNPALSKEEITERLKKMLGAKKVIWLPCGIYNDETDGHVDNIFAFLAPGEAVLAWTNDENDPQYELSRRDLEVLEKETDAKGRKIRVQKMLIPEEPVCIREEDLAGLAAEPGEDEREAGERLAASYVNFYIANACILVPAFGDRRDDRAAVWLAAAFPRRKILRIPARSIIVGGGNFHCITQQIPL